MLFSIPVANMKLAMVRSPHIVRSAGERNVGKPPYSRSKYKQPTGIWLHRERCFIEPDSCGSDVEPVEVRSTECAARRPLNGHCDRLQPFAWVREPADATAVPKGDPQTAFGIDRHPVGKALAFSKLEESAAVRGVSIFQIEDVRDLSCGIAVIHAVAGRAERRAVGDLVALVRDVPVERFAKAIEASGRLSLFVVHCSCPEAAAAINLAVVEPIVGQLRLGPGDDLE